MIYFCILGGFNLQDANAAAEITDRILTMLSQYLVSNQNLELNRTFQVYLKVLSKEHMSDRKVNPVRKSHRKKFSGKKTNQKKVGASACEFKSKWGIDIPTRSNPLFENKCLLLCTIMGILQHAYFQSNKKDKKFIYARSINGKSELKRNHASGILAKQLAHLFSVTKLKQSGPYNLSVTIKILSKFYKCQFFIFDGMSNCSGLILMFPKTYRPDLKPIYLYQPQTEPDHVVFIKNINQYFHSNLFVCFACKRKFKNELNKHLCKVRPSCFACRRFFQTSETYVHENLRQKFCDKLVTSETSFNCQICNCIIYSQHCLRRHKRFCNGQGRFGYKCSACNKFSYCGNNTTLILKNEHVCGNSKLCSICHEKKEENHLCSIKIERYPTYHCRLGFLSLICIESCEETSFTPLPLFACILREEHVRGNFSRYIVSNHTLIADNVAKPFFSYDYFSEFHINNFEFSNTKNLKVKVTDDFLKRMQQIIFRSQQDELNNFNQKLLCLLLDENYKNTTYICNINHANVLMNVLNILVNCGIIPNVVKRGNQILSIEIKELAIRFISSNSYLRGDEYSLASQFEINCDKIYFPFKFLQYHNFHYEGSIPPIQDFIVLSDTKESIDNKIIYHREHGKKKWCLRKELQMHCEQQLLILALSILKFVQQSFDFQKNLKLSLQGLNQNDYLNPFNYPLCSISGFVFRLYKCIYLQKYRLFTINNEYGYRFGKQVSKVEHEFCSYMEYHFPEKEFQSAFSNKYGQKYFKESIPDLYSPVSKQAYYLNGCFYHAHYENCLINKNVKGNSIHAFGKTYQAINDEFNQKILSLYENNPNDVKEVIIVWECLFQTEKQQNPDFKLFFDHVYLPHPLTRLKPRDAVRGAFVDVYGLKWDHTMFPNETFYCADINGLYSFCAINFKYMIGKYDILIGRTLQRLKIVNCRFFVDDIPVMGAVFVKILPPKNLYIPYLLCKKKDGSVINTLCKTCAETFANKCQHLDSERALVGVYMISEIEFALQIGYKLLDIYEIHYYKDSAFLLEDFVKKINFYKTKYSDCLQDLKDLTSKKQYCKFLNDRMGLFDENFMLNPSTCSNNKMKRDFYKLLSNSLFGKFLQRDDHESVAFVRNQSELNSYLKRSDLIQDICCLDDKICILSVKKDVRKILPNLKQNMYVGSQITAFARQVIFEHVFKLSQTTNCNLYHVDCDCIFFSFPNDSPIPLEFSHAVGDFKHEYLGKITHYYAFGPKQYCITSINDGVTNFTCKFSGLSLKSFCNENQINQEIFELYLNQFIEGNNETMQISQVRSKTSFKNLTSRKIQQFHSFSNKISNRRQVDTKHSRLKTYPYGYEKE